MNEVKTERRMCTTCWRKLFMARADEKSPNFTSAFRIAGLYATYWCEMCNKPASGYVRVMTPHGAMVTRDERVET